jgi:hypothetical protein
MLDQGIVGGTCQFAGWRSFLQQGDPIERTLLCNRPPMDLSHTTPSTPFQLLHEAQAILKLMGNPVIQPTCTFTIGLYAKAVSHHSGYAAGSKKSHREALSALTQNATIPLCDNRLITDSPC